MRFDIKFELRVCKVRDIKISITLITLYYFVAFFATGTFLSFDFGRVSSVLEGVTLANDLI